MPEPVDAQTLEEVVAYLRAEGYLCEPEGDLWYTEGPLALRWQRLTSAEVVSLAHRRGFPIQEGAGA